MRATSAVGAGGGVLTFTPALTNSYRTRNYTAASNGQSRWQAIRIPQYASATASNVTALAWNGATGGVVAMDVENALTLCRRHCDQRRRARLPWRRRAAVLGGAAGADTDFRTLASVQQPTRPRGRGSPAPRAILNNTTAYNAAPIVLDAGAAQEGYPNGSYARGAPGNAGGGGTDGNPPANDENTGGGGGSNYGIGGQGGNAWNSGDTSGGRGGAPFSGILAANRVFLGGGGGAGTTNNGTADAATYSAPAGIACSAAAGACSSGAAGGGIVLIRAGSITGSGLVNARGADGYNVLNDGAGGGGGGGTVVLQSYFGGSATVDVSGGNGGNAWRGHTIAIDRHGPGGGGGGGFIAYSPSTGFAVTRHLRRRAPRPLQRQRRLRFDLRQRRHHHLRPSAGAGGTARYLLPAGHQGGRPGRRRRRARQGRSRRHPRVHRGLPQRFEHRHHRLQHHRPPPRRGELRRRLPDRDPFGRRLRGAPTARTTAPATTSLLASNVTLPAGGIITARLRGTANAPVCSDVLNQADSVQSAGNDVLGLTDNADNTQNEGGLPSGTYISQTSYGTGGASDPTGFTMGCPNLSDLDQELGRPQRRRPEAGGRAALHRHRHRQRRRPGDRRHRHRPHPRQRQLVQRGQPSRPGPPTAPTPPAAATAPAISTSPASTSRPAAASTDRLRRDHQRRRHAGHRHRQHCHGFPPDLAWRHAAGAAGDRRRPRPYPPGESSNLYLYGAAGYPLSRTPTPNAAPHTSAITLAEATGTQTWTLSQNLERDFALDRTVATDVTVNLYLGRASTWNTGSNRVITVTLDCSAGGSSISQTRTGIGVGTTPTVYPFTLPVPSAATPFTCAAGNQLRLRVDNSSSGTGTRAVYVYPVSGGNLSQALLPTSTVINVDSITYYDAGGSELTTITPGQAVHIRATVSDPFGSYDINPTPGGTLPTITLTNPGGTAVISAAAMTELGALTTAGTKTFEYAYTVPAANSAGNWTVRVDAVEGTEGTVSDYALQGLTVTPPPAALTFLKTVATESDPVNGTSSPQPIPGAWQRYTLLVTNSGAGSVDNNTLLITDPIPANTSLFVDDLGDGSPVLFADPDGDSGFVAPQPFTLSYSNKSDCSDYNYTPISTGGFDANVCRLRVQMNGSFAGAAGTVVPDFSLTFRVRLD